MVKRILVLCPTHRDRRELGLSETSWLASCEVQFYGENPYREIARFDATAYIEEASAAARAAGVDGVLSTDDYPGTTLAGIVARRLALPHVDPAVTQLCQHKYHCREAQERLVPEAVPSFGLVDLDRPVAPLPFPFFVKPVKSYMSILARSVRDQTELDDFARTAADDIRAFCRAFDELSSRFPTLTIPSAYLQAEELLEGHQVTLEAFVHQGRFRLLAVIDSIMVPGTLSFERFEYPSCLDAETQDRMASIAERFMLGIGFDDGIFNMEFFYDASSGGISIIEVNPRMCSVFADLMEKVHGMNTYEILLALSLGEDPGFEPGAGKYSHAATFVLRTLADRRVVRVPGADELRHVSEWFPDVRAEVLCAPGTNISAEPQDLQSYRYGIVNVGGTDRADLFDRFAGVMSSLTFELTDPHSPTDPLGSGEAGVGRYGASEQAWHP